MERKDIIRMPLSFFVLMLTFVVATVQSRTCEVPDLRAIMIKLNQLNTNIEQDHKSLIRQVDKLSTADHKQLNNVSIAIKETFTEGEKILNDRNNKLATMLKEVDTAKMKADINFKAISERVDLLSNDLDRLTDNIASLMSTMDRIAEDLQFLVSETDKVKGLTQCPDGWMSHNKSCYLFSVTGKSFIEAATVCSNLGTHLVYVDSEAENNFLKSTLAIMKVYGYWIGLADLGTEGTWLLYNNNTVPRFFDWNPGEPNNVDDEDCAHFWTENYAYRWNDETCSYQYFFICEQEFKL